MKHGLQAQRPARPRTSHPEADRRERAVLSGTVLDVPHGARHTGGRKSRPGLDAFRQPPDARLATRSRTTTGCSKAGSLMLNR